MNLTQQLTSLEEKNKCIMATYEQFHKQMQVFSSTPTQPQKDVNKPEKDDKKSQ
jgi:hypothetical protein